MTRPRRAARTERRRHDAHTRARRLPERSRRDRRAVETAIRDGYRLIDTAAAYLNEEQVGEGIPNGGRLHAGVRLPGWGLDHFTWDPVRDRRPNPPDRRWGTDRLVRAVLEVLRAHRSANPGAASVGIGDLSPPGGGPFASGGHLSHQNGLDVDVYYPRRDRRLRAPATLEQVDRALAQDLVKRFVAAGARYVFVDGRLGLEGPPRVVQLGLEGPPRVVQHWPDQEDHLHVRLTGD